MTIGIYRAFDQAGRLLYIGHSVDVDARLAQHAQTQPPWFLLHASIEVEEYGSAEEAQVAEARAIATEHPRWNIEHRSADHPDGFVRSAQQASWLRAERDVANKVRKARQKVSQLRAELRAAEIELRSHEAVLTAISSGALDFTDLDDA